MLFKLLPNFLIKKIVDKVLFAKEQDEIKIFKDFLVKEAIATSVNSLVFTTPPYVKKYPGSRLVIGNSCSFINHSQENRAGIGMVCVISTETATADLEIGEHVGISGAAICCVNRIFIGDYVNIGVGARIYDTDFHPVDFKERRNNPGFDLTKIGHAPVNIEKDVWIGANVIILKGVNIGQRSIVGAGAVVTKSFGEDCIIGGNPAKLIGHI